MHAVAVGLLTLLVCVALQSAAAVAVVHSFLVLRQRGIRGGGFWMGVFYLQLTTVILLLSILAQVGFWAWVFMLCGEFDDYAAAFYHSGVNYATLGYGDLVMSERWRLLGPLQAVNGVLMGGLAAAVLFAALNKLMRNIFEP